MQAGRGAEWMALLALALKGYRPLARRYAVRGGEIDLVLVRGRTVIFVEVKARRRRDDALTAVTISQVRRIGRAADVWLARNPWAQPLSRRGDVVAVSHWRWPHHLPAAFELPASN